MEYKVFTLAELHNFLLCDVCKDDWDEFILLLDGLRERLRYFGLDGGMWRDDFYVVALDGLRVVGVLDYCVCKDSPTFGGDLHFISYVSVDGEYWGRGICGELLATWDEKVRRKDLGVCGCSGFTKMGFNYLRPQLLKLNVKCDNNVRY